MDGSIPVPLPGQFTIVYAFGAGEAPISVFGRSGADGVVYALRAAAADLVVMAGGIGMAPLGPMIGHAIEHRDRCRQAAVLVGARTRGDPLYPSRSTCGPART